MGRLTSFDQKLNICIAYLFVTCTFIVPITIIKYIVHQKHGGPLGSVGPELECVV